MSDTPTEELSRRTSIWRTFLLSLGTSIFSYVTLVYFWIDWQAAGILFVPLSITLSSIVLVGNLLGPVTGGYLKVVAWTLLLTTAHSAGASVVNFFRPGDHLLESAGHGLVAFILLLIAGPLAAFAFSRNND